MSCYYLRSGVHLSITDGAGVLLDLRSGDYIGLNPAQVRKLSTIVYGWPETNAEYLQDEPNHEGSDAELVRSLMGRGLFTQDAAQGQLVAHAAIDAAEERLMDRDSGEKPRISAHHLWNFSRSCWTATSCLRHKPIASIVERVGRRNKKHQPVPLDIAAARDLLSVYFHIRPFFYASRNRCLYDSLVLMEFFARYGIFPNWVLGVKTSPFEAHSWLQHGKYTFNDAPHSVRRFSPILVI